MCRGFTVHLYRCTIVFEFDLEYAVLIEKEAKKGLKKAPKNVQNKFYQWVKLVEKIGAPAVKKIKGFHDEPLKGMRKGQRSIRLNKAWRAIYIESSKSETLTFLFVEEVTHHEY